MSIPYRSKLTFGESHLDIMLVYGVGVPKEAEDRLREFFRQRFSEREGREIPAEEISVSPRRGDVAEETTFFRVELGKPLYIGLGNLNARAPHVLPRLIEDLVKYQEETTPVEPQAQLVGRALTGLRKFIEKGNVNGIEW